MQTPFNIKKTFEFGNTFCVYPFIHRHVNTKKEELPCCYTSSPDTGVSLADIRTLMLDNKEVGSCKGCYNLESSKKISLRQKALRDFLPHIDEIELAIEKHTNGETPEPIWYDLRTSNLCNLECQTCNWESSSSIAAKEKRDDIHLRWESDIKISPNVKRIYLAGGEPFLNKGFSNQLSQITNTDCEIIINTNATILTDHMLKALDRFTNINFTISIDGFGELNDKIRINSKWNDIISNLNILADRYGGKSIFHVNTVVQRDNINELLALGQWISSFGIPKWTLIELRNPEQYRYIHATNIKIPPALLSLDIINSNPENVFFLKNLNGKTQ